MKRPNVMVIMADQLKAGALSLYGNPFCRTPALEELAQSGVLYRYAFTPHPLCVPARVSLWTSQFSHTHRARRNQTFMPRDATHGFKLWKEAGYHTGLIGKNHCFQDASDLELFDTWCEISHTGLAKGAKTKGMEWVKSVEDIEHAHFVRKNMPNKQSPLSYAVTDFPLGCYSTGLIANQTVKFLEDHQNDEFTLWVSFPDPHTPYEVPRKYMDLSIEDGIQLPGNFKQQHDNAPERNRVLYRILGIDEEPEEEVSHAMAAYYGLIRFLDDGVSKILDTLVRLGLRENTIIVFCSDHGDFAGEHGMLRKGGVFYECLTRVPLIVSWPEQIKAGQIDESMVNLIDILPTLLELQGLDIPASMQGQLLPTITSGMPRSETFSEYGAGGPPFTMQDYFALSQKENNVRVPGSLEWREAEGRRKMIRTKEWKYVHDPTGDKDELYNMLHDPWELNNIAEYPKYREIVHQLRLRLLDWAIMTEESPTPLSKEDLVHG